MKDILQLIRRHIRNKQPFATATVIQTWGSAPRPIGSIMLIAQDGTISGSVSGGCIEGAVIKNALDCITTGKPSMLNFGVTDDEAWAVGLSCGGSIQVFVEPFISLTDWTIWNYLLQYVITGKSNQYAKRGCILLTQLNNEAKNNALVLPDGKTTNNSISDFLKENALRAYTERKTQILESEHGEKWFLHVFPPKHHLVIIGAAHITVDLVHLAHFFDFDTTVIDPRSVFVNQQIFITQPNRLYVDWPAEVLPTIPLDTYTYTVLLTHDPKIDDQALHILLPSNVAYIGCLGSKKTHEKRIKRLIEAGFTNHTEGGGIGKIHAPIGVDIHAKSAREIALSIMGELIKVKNQF